MHRIDTPTAENEKFVDGNLEQGRRGTQVDSSFLNSVQEEIANAITGFGVSLDKTKDNQLYSVLSKYMISNIYEKTPTPVKDEENGVYILTNERINVEAGQVLDISASFDISLASSPSDFAIRLFDIFLAKSSSIASSITSARMSIQGNSTQHASFSIRMILPKSTEERRIDVALKPFGTGVTINSISNVKLYYRISY